MARIVSTRQEGQRVFYRLENEHASQLVTDAIFQAAEIQVAVRAAVGKLPATQRAALLLLREEGLGYEELADALETSVSAVKSLLNRARKALAAELQPFLEHPLAAPGAAGGGALP